MVLFTTIPGCYGQPPTQYAREVVKAVEQRKLQLGTYPTTIEGNVVGTYSTHLRTNDLFYLVDSAKLSFTLKVYNGNGLSDIYDSKTKRWVRTDK